MANVAAWAVIHAGTGYAAHRLPPTELGHDGWLLRVRPFEVNLYRRLGIRRWKDRLPEAGALFPAGSASATRGSLALFVRRPGGRSSPTGGRGRGPRVVLWNPLGGFVLMVAYGVASTRPSSPSSATTAAAPNASPRRRPVTRR